MAMWLPVTPRRRGASSQAAQDVLVWLEEGGHLCGCSAMNIWPHM